MKKNYIVVRDTENHIGGLIINSIFEELSIDCLHDLYKSLKEEAPELVSPLILNIIPLTD